MNLKEISKIRILKLENSINGVLDVPSSKSLTIRALILATFSNGNSTIKNVLDSDDTNNCINCIRELGIKIEQNNRDFTIYGCNGIIKNDKDLVLFAGSSGITARFLTAMLSATYFNYTITMDGTPQLRKRPIKPLVDALLKIGCDIQYLENDGFLPLKIIAKKILTMDKTLQISGKDSSQYVSAVLMLAPLIGLKVQPIDIDDDNHPYVQMALQTMKDFGIKYNENSGIYNIEKQLYKSTDFTIETDCNTANYFFSLAVLTNSKIEINNINKNTLQPGILFLPILEKLGAKITYKDTSIIVEGDKIKGGFELDMLKTAEMAITLSVLAIFADAPIKIYGVEHIRKHETDRIKAIATELIKLGVKTEEFDDGIKIYPTSKLNSGIEINTYEDHRIAMSFALLGIKNNIILLDPKCVSKTCPEFFDMLEKIGIKIDYIK